MKLNLLKALISSLQGTKWSSLLFILAVLIAWWVAPDRAAVGAGLKTSLATRNDLLCENSLQFEPVGSTLEAKYRTSRMGGNPAQELFFRTLDAKRWVPYFTRDQRPQFLVSFEKGLVRDDEGALLGMLKDRTGPQEYLYVMEGTGNFLIGLREEVRSHSAFLAGGPVAAAGTLAVRKGKILSISNHSGHYRQPIEYICQAVRELKIKGVGGFKILIKDWPKE